MPTILERIFARQISDKAAEFIPAIRAEVERTTAAEATAAGEADYAFRHLSANAPGGGGGMLTLPEIFREQAIRDSHWQYETHGLAYLIISRMLSIIFEAGLQYTMQYDDAVPDAVRAAIDRRIQEWWDSEDTDMQDRAREFVLEVLLSGEHGWRFFVDPDNGFVEIGDLARASVEDVRVDARDQRKIGAVVTRRDIADKESISETLAPVRLCRDSGDIAYKHLSGNVLYHRLDTRSSKKRGSPILQRVVDELKAEKRFTVLATDRFVERMKTFVSVTLANASAKQVEDYANKQPKSIPTGVWYGSDQVKREMVSANLEGYEINNIIRTFITIILGSFGMPISWAGFGDGSTRATSETQQEPAAQDARRMKSGLLGVFEKTLYFVADQFIVHNPQIHSPLEMLTVTDPKTGATSQRLLRDCITINVATRPLEERKPEGSPLAATKAVYEIVALDDLRNSEIQQRLLTDDTIVALVNYALSRDGVGIEIEPPPAATEPEPETDRKEAA